MNTKYINFILIGVIAVVVGGMGFFGWRMVRDRQANDMVVGKKEFPLPAPITNKGKESEDRDAAMERDVRMISDAALAYAKDNGGRYPKSDFKNPCSGVRYCLKGADINIKAKAYLEAVPQVEPYGTDYYYRAENGEKAYCVKTPSILETAVPMVFQCTEKMCGRVLFGESCH